MGRAASTRTEVKMVLEDSDLRNKIKAQQREIKTQEKLLERLGREGKISFTKIEKGADRAGKSIRRAGQTQAQGFSRGAMRRLQGVALQYIGIAAAVRGVTAALRIAEQVKEEAAARSLEGEFPRAKLAQLAIGDPAKFKQLQDAVDQAVAAGIPEAAGAAKLVFDLESAQALKEKEFFFKLQGLADSVALVGASAKLIANLGKEETGSFRDLVSKGLAGAGPVPGAAAKDILMGAARASQAGRALGLSDEELIAAQSVLAQTARDPAVAATQLEGLLLSLAKQGFVEKFKGKPLADMLQNVAEKALDTPELIEFFGRKEAAIGFAVLKDRQRFEARIETIKQAQAEDAAGGLIKLAAAEERVAAPRAARIAKGQLERAEIPEGLLRKRTDEVKSRFLSSLAEEGVGPMRRGIIGISLGISRLVKGDEDFLEQLLQDITELEGKRSAVFKEFQKLTQEAGASATQLPTNNNPTTVINNNIGMQKNIGVHFGNGAQAGVKTGQGFHEDGGTG